MLLEKSEYIGIFIYTGESSESYIIVLYVVDYYNCYNDVQNVVNYYIILYTSHLYVHLMVVFADCTCVYCTGSNWLGGVSGRIWFPNN